MSTNIASFSVKIYRNNSVKFKPFEEFFKFLLVIEAFILIYLKR